jgi:hypothetical protein
MKKKSDNGGLARSGRPAIFEIALFLILGMAMGAACRAASCTVPPTGIVGWWPAEGSANDIAGTNSGALLGGASANATGYVGSAFGFNGTNGYVRIPDSPAFHLATLTIEAWVKFVSLNSAGAGAAQGEQFIVFKQNSRSTGFKGFYLGKTRISNQDRLTFQVCSSSGVRVEVDSTTVVRTGIWYHVAGVRGSNSLQLYVNGQLQSQSAVGFPQDYGSLPLYFGTSGQPSWDRKLKGELDEVSLYNRALTTNEIAAIYAAGAAGKCRAPRIAAQPQSRSVPTGTTVSFAVVASGTAPLGYQWWFNGASISNGGQYFGAATATLWVSNAQPANSGGYSVVVSNTEGSATSTVAALTVNPRTSCVAPPAGMIGWWPGGGSGRDIFGTNDAILRGGATDSAPGKVGTAFNFDGTNGYAQIPNAPELNPSNVTVECWVRFDRLDSDGTNPQGNAYLVFKQNTRTAVFEGINLAKHRVTGGDIIVWEVSSAAGQPVQINSVTFVTTNVWYYVAGVRGSNYTQLYINGQLEAQGSVDFPQNYGNYPLYFGTSGEPYWDRRLAGSLDEVSLYKRALSGSEIAAIYAAGAAGKCQAMPAIAAPPVGGTFYFGSSFTMASAVSGSPPLQCQWTKSGMPVPGATTTSLTLTNLQTTNAGSYVLIVTNSMGRVSSAPAVVQVKAADLSFLASGSPPTVGGLQIGGVPGQTYGIQCTTNLSSGHWQGLTNLTLTASTIIWNDPQPMSSPQRFYRLVLGPVSIP